jgi:hypothetical protein
LSHFASPEIIIYFTLHLLHIFQMQGIKPLLIHSFDLGSMDRIMNKWSITTPHIPPAAAWSDIPEAFGRVSSEGLALKWH